MIHLYFDNEKKRTIIKAAGSAYLATRSTTF